MTTQREEIAPRPLVAGVAGFVAALGAVAAATVVDRLAGGGPAVGTMLLAGVPAAVLVGAGTGWTTAGLATRVRRVLDALHSRVRMADEVGERHRRSAETASAGMFELLAGLVAAEEGARGQLSAELHDTVAQSLMAARALLADGTDKVADVGELVAEAEEQVRAVMARTRPPALRDGDLARAVATLRDDLANRYGLRVDLAWPTEAYPLPLATAVTVYRFFQEALLNVVKHADVDVAHAMLRVDADSVEACVRDDGPGFDPADVRPDQGRHIGLGLLRERARLVGGSLEVASWPASGAALTLRLPRTPGATAGSVPMPRPAEMVQLPSV
jgi:two-component system sensor histidine kinase UhpB